MCPVAVCDPANVGSLFDGNALPVPVASPGAVFVPCWAFIADVVAFFLFFTICSGLNIPPLPCLLAQLVLPAPGPSGMIASSDS